MTPLLVALGTVIVWLSAWMYVGWCTDSGVRWSILATLGDGWEYTFGSGERSEYWFCMVFGGVFVFLPTLALAHVSYTLASLLLP